MSTTESNLSVTLALTGEPDGPIRHLLQDYPTTRDMSGASMLLYHQLIRETDDLNHRLTLVHNTYRSYRVPVVVCLLCDTDEPIQIPPSLRLLRTSLLKSRQRSVEWPLPYLFETWEGAFCVAPRRALPTVGFCGLSNPWRQPLLDAFQSDDRFSTSFVLRDKFWGGEPFNSRIMDEFWRNIINNQFTVASRGAGNFSMRFWQVLSAGRIPVLVDTDLSLPFDSEIDWDAHIVRASTIDRVQEIVLDWQRQGCIEKKQLANYELYRQHFAGGRYLSKQLGLIDRISISKKGWLNRLLS